MITLIIGSLQSVRIQYFGLNFDSVLNTDDDESVFLESLLCSNRKPIIHCS